MNSHKIISTLLGLTSLTLLPACGEKQLVDLTINDPCNWDILADADKIQVALKSESAGFDDVTTMDNKKDTGDDEFNYGNWPIEALLPDAVISVRTLNKDGEVTAAVTFGPKDLTAPDKVILNVAPGRVNTFNVTTEVQYTCGSMNYGRVGHTATTLKDGRVFIVGGEYFGKSADDGVGIEETEFYDPSTSAFTKGPKLPGGSRKYHTATLLDDGRVLIAGGIGQLGATQSLLKQILIYDPATNDFSTNNIKQPRAHLTATKLADGSVLLAGGSDTQNGYFKNLEIWKPDGTVTDSGEFKKERAFHNAVSLPNGNVAFIGGQNTSGALDSVEIFDAKSGNIQTGEIKMNSPRTMAASALIDKSTIAVTGGYNSALNLAVNSAAYPKSMDSLELIKFNGGQSYDCSDTMTSARAQHLISPLPNGENGQPRLLITGGRTENGLPAQSAEIITINSTANNCANVAESIHDMNYKRANHAQAILPGGDILFIGGQESQNSTGNTAEYYTLPIK